VKEDIRKESIVSLKTQDDKESSRPASQASAVSDKSAPEKAEEVSPVKEDIRKKSVVSLTAEKKPEDEKESSRPASQASIVSDKVAPEKEKSPEPVKEDIRKESVVSLSAEKKPEDEKESSRSASQASIISDKVAPEKEKSPEPEKDDIRKESIVSLKPQDDKESSRPASQASAVSEKSVHEKFEEVKEDIRKESISVVQSLSNVIKDTVDLSISSLSNITSSITKTVEEIRPESPSSIGENDIKPDCFIQPGSFIISDKQSTYERPHSPASVSSQISDRSHDIKEEGPDINIRRKSSVSIASDNLNIDESFSRPETPPSAECDVNENDEQMTENVEQEDEERRESISKAERLFESRRESQKNTVDDSAYSFPISKDFDLSDEKIFLKESRSKSVSSICSTSSRTDDFGKLSAIEEILASSKEDLKMSTTKLVEHCSKMEEAASKDFSELMKSETTITSFPVTREKVTTVYSTDFPLQQDFSSKSFTQSSTEMTKTQTVTTKTITSKTECAIVTETTDSATEKAAEGKKTPPTVPVSPNVISSSQKVAHPSDVCEKASEISTPRDSIHSGRSSPDSAASKSIILGHGSAVESPESSPKPTSPFPKTIEALKADEEHKTSSGISTPDMTRTSTPDTTEKLIDIKSSAIMEEKSEFKSKVHTQDFGYHTGESKESKSSSFYDSKTSRDSYHTEWSSGSFKKDEDEGSISQEHHYIYEGMERFRSRT
jgi:hypothetical protein